MKKDLKISQNTVIHCPTKELADKVSIILDRLGYRWCDGDKFTEKCRWASVEEDYYINPISGTFGWCVVGRSVGSPIISAEDFIKLHTDDFGLGDIRKGNVGRSNYSKFKIQPWDIIDEYNLTYYDGSILAYLLRTKIEPDMTPEEARIMDYNKIIHYCQKCISKLEK